MQERGFTLIEVMFALVILGVLLGLAAPSFQEMMRTNRLAGATNEFVAALHMTRSEAIKESRRVIVCRTNNPNAATPACGGGTGWENGWVIFRDTDNDAAPDAGEVLAVHQALHPSLTLRGNGVAANSITYGADGMAAGIANATLTTCATNATDARQIILSRTGRPRTTKTTASGNC